MHYHLEVILPPTHDVEKDLNAILAPFDENAEEPDHPFWDWWVIGGRWAGVKQEARFPEEKLDAFRQWLTDEHITVSGVQFGKQELSPASQIAKVDAKWQQMFGVTTPCTLFRHSNSGRGALDGDICTVKDLPDSLTASHVIIAGPAYKEGIEACYMVQQECWNGVTHVKSDWDGNVCTALDKWRRDMEHYRDEWREAHTPKEDWLVVTVDYHS